MTVVKVSAYNKGCYNVPGHKVRAHRRNGKYVRNTHRTGYHVKAHHVRGYTRRS